MDVGISVSRVGGDAQVKAMKKVAGTLKITLAQYRSMAAFAMLASDLDATTRRQLTRGEKLMELLKQPQGTPYPVEEQICSIWAGTNGYLDDIATDKVLQFERDWLDYLRKEESILKELRETGAWPDELVARLETAVKAFRKTYELVPEKKLDAIGGEAEAEHSEEQIVARSSRS